MNNKDFFGKPSTLWFFTFLTVICAAASLYFCFIDDFLHTLVLLFDYVLMLVLAITVGNAFEKGEKELVKVGAASIFTLAFLVFVKTFVDIIYLNNYYLFSTNHVATAIGIITILIFILFAIAYLAHFLINKSNASATSLVKLNKTLLIICFLLCITDACLILYNDTKVGRAIEYFLVVSYATYAFICLLLVSIEVLVNNFRIAREKGKLDTYAKKLVGEEAAKTAKAISGKKTLTKKTSTKKTKKK